MTAESAYSGHNLTADFTHDMKRTLNSLDFTKAPEVIEVRLDAARVVYLKQPNGYIGLVFDLKKNTRYYMAHRLDVQGPNAGWLSPQRLNWVLAQKSLNGGERATYEERNEVITRILTTIAFAIKFAEENSNKDVDLKDYGLGLPKWLSVVKGEMSEKDIEEAVMLGVDNYILDYCAVTGRRPVIDVELLLHRNIRRRDVRVVKGEWDEVSDRMGQQAMIRSNVVELANRYGLRLEKVTRD